MIRSIRKEHSNEIVKYVGVTERIVMKYHYKSREHEKRCDYRKRKSIDVQSIRFNRLHSAYNNTQEFFRDKIDQGYEIVLEN